MAYKQQPGRSPFLKTGRGIPLNFLSPLHDGTGHPHPHETEGVNRKNIIPAYETKTLDTKTTLSGDSKSSSTSGGSDKFNTAFSGARERGDETFEFNGKSYNTKLSDDSSSGGSSTEIKKDESSEIKQLGNKSLQNVEDEGNVERKNIMSKMEAEVLQGQINQASDSSAYVQHGLKDASTIDKSSDSDYYKDLTKKGGAVSYQTGVENKTITPQNALNRYLTGQNVNMDDPDAVKTASKGLSMDLAEVNLINKAASDARSSLTGRSNTGYAKPATAETLKNVTKARKLNNPILPWKQ